MKNLTNKQLFILVDDVLNGQWNGDTSKPIMIWFWDVTDREIVNEHLQTISELAGFQGQPLRHSTYMYLGFKRVKVADHPEYAKRFCLPSSFNDHTKGFLYRLYGYEQPFDPEYLYDCRELIQNTHLPLIGLVNDYEKEACEKKGITVDMESFINYRYIGKTMQDWLAEATAIDEDGLPQLPPCITDFVSDEQIKDLFFYHDEEPDPIESDKRLFAPDSWHHVMYHLWTSYVDYHESIFGNKYNTTIEYLNGEYGLGLAADASKEEIDAHVDTIPNALTRKLARELASWFDSFGFKDSQNIDNKKVYSDIEDFLISGNAENDICGQHPMNRHPDFYNQWIEWLKARKAGK